jgi:hypothetical protein
MAKITVYIPEPSTVVYNQIINSNKILQALDTLKSQLKFWLSTRLEK